MADNPKLIDGSCPVRPCVVEKGINNCSQCEHFVCDRLRERLVVYEQMRLRFGADIPAEDRIRFIQPYENRQRLDALRSSERANRW
jgi:hypothetical protein